MLKEIVSHLEKNPKSLFLIDGIGALISAFMLGIILVKLKSIFGIPISTLYFLASLPVFFAAFDFYSYRKKYGLQKNLRRIAIMNLLYCVLSLGMAILHSKSISLWGWGYIIIEVLIVSVLAFFEYQISKKIK